jgi:hypothetical protein
MALLGGLRRENLVRLLLLVNQYPPTTTIHVAWMTSGAVSSSKVTTSADPYTTNAAEAVLDDLGRVHFAYYGVPAYGKTDVRYLLVGP